VSSGAIEIITGRERRRRWSIEEKLRIVAETEEGGARVTEVAARHGVYPGLLFTWRRQVRDGVLAAPPPAATFMPVRMLGMETAANPDPHSPATGEQSTLVTAPGLRDERIDITLPNGCRLRVDQQIDVRALRRIVGVLRG
jgi:transposase